MRRRRGGSRRLSPRTGPAGWGEDADGDGGARRRSEEAFLKRPLRLSLYATIPSAEEMISDYFGGGGDGDGGGAADGCDQVGWTGLRLSGILARRSSRTWSP
ncbi:hypothetical protein ACJRO7_032237 [Eucalyptus globulus]|uniref:Uncharacterized protein n=1 Tax=Eucalyptus globulus TaxID=34317 RepID=A0ABD3JIX8_EUCGL